MKQAKKAEKVSVRLLAFYSDQDGVTPPHTVIDVEFEEAQRLIEIGAAEK